MSALISIDSSLRPWSTKHLQQHFRIHQWLLGAQCIDTEKLLNKEYLEQTFLILKIFDMNTYFLEIQKINKKTENSQI